MKRILLQTLVVFLVSILSIHAQEKETIHLKIIREKDGKVIEETDTFYVTNGEGVYYLGGEGIHESRLDSILGDYRVCTHKGHKFIAISDKSHSCDSVLKKFWHIHEEHAVDSITMEHWHFYRDGNHPKIKHGKGLAWIALDSLEVVHDIHVDGEEGIIILKSGEGENVEIIKKKIDKSMVWAIDSLGNLNSTDNKNVFFYSTGTSTFDILESEHGEHKIMKEIIIGENGEFEKDIEIILGNVEGGEKTIKMFFDENSPCDSAKRKKIEVALKELGEDVKITKYKTEDDKIAIKAEISREAKKVDEVKTKKMNLKHGSEKGLFNIDLKLAEMVPTIIIVENKEGKTVYSKKLKKFDGKYSGTIDITKEPDGKYILQIIQDNKTVIQKEMIK